MLEGLRDLAKDALSLSLTNVKDGEQKYLPQVGYLYHNEPGLEDLSRGAILTLKMDKKPTAVGNLVQSIFNQTLSVLTKGPRQRNAAPVEGATQISKGGFQNFPENSRHNELAVVDNDFTSAKLQEVSDSLTLKRAEEIVAALRSGLSHDPAYKLKNPFRPGDNLATAELLVIAADHKLSHHRVPQAGANERWKSTLHAHHDVHHQLVEHGHVVDENDLVSLQDGKYRQDIQTAVRALVSPAVDLAALAAEELEEAHRHYPHSHAPIHVHERHEEG